MTTAPRPTRRGALGGMGLGALAAGLAACGGDPGAATEGAGGDAVEFVFLGDVNQRKQFEQLFAEFGEQHPEIALQAVAKSGSWAQFTYAVATQIAGGQPPDIIQMATEGQRLFASKGVLAPLDQLIARDQDEVEDYYDDIHDNLRLWSQKYGSPDGSTYYMPGGYNPIVQYCRTDLLDRAGVELPEDGFSWSDLMEAGRRLKAQGVFLMTVEQGYWHDVLPWLTNNGTSSLDEDWATATINSPEAIEAAAFARELVAKGYSPEPGGTYDAPSLMQNGQLAAFHDGAYGMVNAARIELTDAIRMVPFPHNGVHGSPVGWDAWDITEASERADEAWVFIKYLMSVEGASFFARAGGTIVPARHSVATSDAFLEGAPEGALCLVDALETATPVPSPERGPEIQDIVEEGWLQIIAGYAEPERQLKRTYDKIGPLL
ncbi:ABC transporter substrate-binding protein [Brachybacterium sacelli]|uniref:Multiple sugar transport system substrate-binding protein n=1 Tax=Brachybacterium sacelli TaxID=173364 RepID=A0ABS4WYQ4_9MICO|nr:sugar ABC transporter substrate-binding protein [Brachybacterium sacelli]MBP2381336.1 multiple sugar transport system substrate-binding protein [Brachybacterium sacelli]